MLSKIINSVSYKVSPRVTHLWQSYLKLQREAALLRIKLDRTPELDEKIDQIFSSKDFSPLQKRSELKSFMRSVALLRPSAICEIGGANGGTLAAFCEVANADATLISIDFAYSATRRIAHKKLARNKQKVCCIAADSHDVATLNRVRRVLGDRKLDVLLIDGDHTYEGVKLDFEMYSPLVRTGGVVAFHDISPDSFMRSGIKSDAYVGGVPIFWREVAAQHADKWEIIEDLHQDGYGIGFIRAA